MLISESYRKDAMSSSSSRRTWIEICTLYPDRQDGLVVLLAEDVDRNTELYPVNLFERGRPPRGGRG